MQRIPIQVIFEDNHLIAVNKPAGMLVHGDQTGDITLADHVKQYIKDRYNKPGDVFLGVIHRLDRPVSGVVIFARTTKALSRMNALLRDKQVEKTYHALTRDRLPDFLGTLKHHLAKDSEHNKVKAYASEKKGTKLAITEYEQEGDLDSYRLYKLKPITGRPHQLRVQLAKSGAPIVGDFKYGSPQPNHDKSISLHCSAMSFVHPVQKEKVTITAPLPTTGYWQIFN